MSTLRLGTVVALFSTAVLCSSALAAPPTRDVNVVNTPNVTVVNTPAEAIPTAVQSLPARFLVHEGQSFSLAPDPNIAFELSVPEDVVLTDFVLSLNGASLATTVFVQDTSTGDTLVFQSVGSEGSTFAGSNEGQLSLHFQSGLQGADGLRIGLTCNNIGGNSCSGALMWSGYEQP